MRIVAMGNELRGDDGVGIFVGEVLRDKGFDVIFAYENPENVLNQLKGAGRILFVDAAQFDSDCPFVITKRFESSSYTHRADLSKIAKFTDSEVLLLGINTYKRGEGKGLSEAAMANALKAVLVIEVCMAIPAIVEDADNKVVRMGEKEKKVRFAVPGLVKGDFVLVHAGAVIEKLDEDSYDKIKGALDFNV